MPENNIYEDDDIILPDGFNVETGQWEDEAPVDSAPTIEPEAPVDQPEVAAEEEPQPAPETPEPTSQTEVPTQAPATIKVRYNHEDREIGLDEAAILAQKGLNYDKLDERLKSYEQANSRSEALAKRLGYDSAAAMFDAAETSYVESKVKDLVDAGNTEAMARFLVNQELDKQAKAYEAEAQKSQPSAEEVPQYKPIQNERMSELEEFVKAYPGITKLPDEVIQANRNGTRLLVAYERYQNKAALNELAILKQNQAAAARAPVSGVAGKPATTAPDIDDDPFMKGFNNSYPR